MRVDCGAMFRGRHVRYQCFGRSVRHSPDKPHLPHPQMSSADNYGLFAVLDDRHESQKSSPGASLLWAALARSEADDAAYLRTI